MVKKTGSSQAAAVPPALDRRFEAVVLGWDGSAFADRRAGAGRVRGIVEALCAHGLDLAVVTGMDVGSLDGRLGARPPGPGNLYLCVERGSEVFRARQDGLTLLHRREATAEEAAALDSAAAATVAELAQRGLNAQLLSPRPDRRTIELSGAGDHPDGVPVAAVRDAIEVALAATDGFGLADARVSSDARRVEIGMTDESDSARWLFAELARRGIPPGLVLVAGGRLGPAGAIARTDSLVPAPEAARVTTVSVATGQNGVPRDVLALHGGPDVLVAVLADQLERRRRGDVPELDGDPAWTVTVDPADGRPERVRESLLTLADGRLGTRGSPLVGGDPADSGVVLSGVYEGEGFATELAAAPPWATLRAPRTLEARRRRLDLRSGLLREEGAVDSLRFSSLARPATVALRASGPPEFFPRGGRRRLGRAVRVALRDRRHGRVLERIGAYDADDAKAARALAKAERLGFERLLGEHRREWARRWEHADVVVEGDPELQLAIRFALFHLMACVADRGEAGVGARGLSGSAYRGHVFWDSDIFVLPFLAATHPEAARAMLEYRLRRLPQAREAARKLGRAGARFPWESAADGFDVTPPYVRLPNGQLIRVRTGELEEHIVADVAWAAACYLDWTGDWAFAAGPGRELFVETARYWASRARLDRDGRAHIYGVIGPDEYHEPVDDNAYTNVMARWNLRRAASLDGLDDRERASWLALADALVDGYDATSGIYEQFAGFFALEPLVIAEIAPRRPVTADVLLGRERTLGAQVVKQADVLMLHQLVPDEVAPGSLVPNLDFYEPRTAHGSSLSPAIHASLFARAGRYRAALETLRIAALIDLEDLTGTAAAGLHVATMGGVWQALAFGFAGVRPRGDRLVVDPRLPREWNALELALRFRGEPLRLRIDRAGVSVLGDAWAVRRADTHWELERR